MWWDNLPTIEKGAIINIDFLVGSVEDMITAECKSWASSTGGKRDKEEDKKEQNDTNKWFSYATVIFDS